MADASAERLNQVTTSGIRKNSAAFVTVSPVMAMPSSVTEMCIRDRPKVIAYNAKDPTAKARYGVIADKMHLGGGKDVYKRQLIRSPVVKVVAPELTMSWAPIQEMSRMQL